MNTVPECYVYPKGARRILKMIRHRIIPVMDRTGILYRQSNMCELVSCLYSKPSRSILYSHRWMVLILSHTVWAISLSVLPRFLSTSACSLSLDLPGCSRLYGSSGSDNCTPGRYSSPLFTSAVFGMGVWRRRGDLCFLVCYSSFRFLANTIHHMKMSHFCKRTQLFGTQHGG